jgi:hypothetical protein
VAAADDRAQQGAEPETGHPPTRSLAQLESSQAAIRDTTKWLIAAAAAVAAVLVAGLQLKDVPHGTKATAMALLGVAAALVAVAFILAHAAGVLRAGYTTFGGILELDAKKSYTDGQDKAEWLTERIKEVRRPRGTPPAEAPAIDPPGMLWRLFLPAWRLYLPVLRLCSPVVIPVLSRARKRALRRARDEGVRIRDLINHLNQDSFYFTQGLAKDTQDLNQALRETDEDILRLRGGLISGPPPAGGPVHPGESRASAQAQLAEAEWRQERLESAMNVLIAFANQMLLEQRFRKLLSTIFYGGAVIVIGVGAFVVAPKLGTPQALSVTQPIQVTIRVIKGLGPSCKPGTLLQGVAVGGTWDKPVVVTEEKDGCPAKEMTLDDGQAVAVPVLGPSPSASATPSP